MNQRIAHVTLLVRDYDEAIAFYRADFSVTQYLKASGERVTLTDLGHAAKTLRIYSGFLQLALAAKRNARAKAATEPETAQAAGGTLVAD